MFQKCRSHTSIPRAAPKKGGRGALAWREGRPCLSWGEVGLLRLWKHTYSCASPMHFKGHQVVGQVCMWFGRGAADLARAQERDQAQR